jgi:nicotinate phosphoribosyltransferase
VEVVAGPSTFQIEVSGPWPETTLWETIILCIVTELYGRSLLRRHEVTAEQAQTEGTRRLAAKIELLKSDPRVRFSDFGTRRRFSRDWQRHVMATLSREQPDQLLGTSNVMFAKEMGLRPIGTFAHEMEMIYSGIFHDDDAQIRASHGEMLEAWWALYGEELSIALTDTYGTDFFFRDFGLPRARTWRGLRHDSGDPFAFGEKAIGYYESLGIDPQTKLIVFSDGLEAERMLRLVERFHGRIQVVFGWGTNLTNDVGFQPLSLVVKAIRACGHATVKLCDNLDKAIGTIDDIERFRRIFGVAQVPRLGVKY